MQSAIEDSIAQATGIPAKIVSTKSASGGCVNLAQLIQLNDAREYFVKTNLQSPPLMFETECLGLTAIQETQTIRIPDVVAYGNISNNQSFLVLELIVTGRRPKNFNESLGQQLAELHRIGTSPTFGFTSDNYLGSSPQPNPITENWAEFWWHQRMDFQFQLARENGFGDSFNSLLPRFQKRIDSLFQNHRPRPSLIHGDLWSGNLLCDSQGQPVLIDPAVYYADRESELGMTTLFGGLDSSFYNAYQETWPLPDGWQERVEIYRLYHLLNHLNLFGSSYLTGCLEIIRKYQ